MPDDVGTETARSDAPSADDGLFGDAPDDTTAADPVAEDATQDAPQDGQDAGDEAAQDDKDSDDSGEETASSEDLKVVVSIKGGRAVIGVQRPSADPHIETFDDSDLLGLAQKVLAVTERAKAGWEDQPKHPAYARPVPVSRRNRRGQGAAQATTTEGEEAQQATLRLF